MGKENFIYLMSKAWFLIIFSAILGYIVVDKTLNILDVLASRIVVSALFPAGIMYAGLIVGFTLGQNKKK